MDCSIVTDKNPHEKPLNAGDVQSPYKPDTLGNIRPNDKYDINSHKEYEHHKPAENGYLQTPSYSGSSSYGSGSPNNYYLPVKPPRDNGDKVQTIVSVASSPDSYYHPVHDILVSDKNKYDNNDKIDNFYGRPPNLYDDRRPNRPIGGVSNGYGRPKYSVHEETPDCDRPDPPYGYKPDVSSGYGSSPVYRPLYQSSSRPGSYDRPDLNLRPIPGGYDGPDPKPRPEGYDRPNQNYDSRPIATKPRPDGYDNPNFDSRPISSKPIQDGYGRPESETRPIGVRPRPDGYDRPEPSYDSRPIRPNPRPDGYDRPEPNYDFRPIRPNPRPDGYDRPNPDFVSRPIELKPKPDGYGNQNFDFRPIGSKPRPDGYDRPNPNFDYRPIELKPRPDGYGNQNVDFRPIVSKPRPDGYDSPNTGYGSKPALLRPKPNGFDKPEIDSGFRPIGYHESSYNGYSSVDKYYTGYGTGHIDRYDVRPERPSDM